MIAKSFYFNFVPKTTYVIELLDNVDINYFIKNELNPKYKIKNIFNLSSHDLLTFDQTQNESQNVIFKCITIQTNELDIMDFIKSKSIKRISKDKIIKIASNSIQNNPNWNLARLNVKNLPLSKNFVYDSKAGEGVRIYVIDSGISPSKDFENRLALGKFFTETSTLDGNGHGTHLAGIAAGTVNGVAKKAILVPVKFLKSDGTSSWSDLMLALQWALQDCKASKSRCVGILALEGLKFDPVNKLISLLTSSGFHVSAAAGNQNKDACATTPGSSSNNGAIVSGNFDVNGYRNNKSNYGSCLTLYAPGTRIISSDNKNYYGTKIMTGTSMSAAMVAGVMALILSVEWYTTGNLRNYLRDIASQNVLKNVNIGPNRAVFLPIK